MAEPVVSVVIPARDAAATLPATLDALAAQDLGRPFEVLVVDDASSDATPLVAARHPVVTRALSASGDGPGAARNVAIRAARAPVVAFTDADCVPAPGWLRAGMEALAPGTPAVDLAQGRVEPASAPGPWDRTLAVHGRSGLWETANLFVRTDALRAVGAFEPWLRPARSKELGEDVWLGWRLVRAGARTAWAPDALVHHAVVPRSAAGWVAERARARFFAPMVCRIPELRTAFLWRGRFLSERQALVDLALLGAVGAAALRRPAPLALALPYGGALWRGARGAGRRRLPAVAAAHLAGDLVAAGALALGSVRARTWVG